MGVREYFYLGQQPAINENLVGLHIYNALIISNCFFQTYFAYVEMRP
jgi:hypothetical protein